MSKSNGSRDSQYSLMFNYKANVENVEIFLINTQDKHPIYDPYILSQNARGIQEIGLDFLFSLLPCLLHLCLLSSSFNILINKLLRILYQSSIFSIEGIF